MSKIQVLVKYSEIALKGGNRSFFENKLKGNIQKSANRLNLKLLSVIKTRGRMICNFDEKESKADIIECLKRVFGIKNFSFYEEIKKDVDSILEKSEQIIDEIIKNKSKEIKTIGFKTKRADKNFKLNSPEINSKIGEIARQKGLKVDYKNPDSKIFIEIGLKDCFVYSKKYKGVDGLPVGTSGRVLVLLSGGIDSPVASYKILSRGCTVDYLHVHSFSKNEFVLKSKMKRIIDKINDFGFKSVAYLLPYSFYEFETLDKIPARYELIFFKHFIFKLADKIAQEYEYDAIVSGDSLAQVASQTIENIRATNYNLQTLVFRPLLTYTKEEIIRFAERIGTYDLSIEEYKDCCSIVAKNPMTQTNLSKFKKIIEECQMDELVQKSFEEIERFIFK